MRKNALLTDILFRPVKGGKGAFYSIDILRGLAAMAILIFHYKNFFVGTIEIPMARMVENPMAQSLWIFHKYGANAVMLFWVISGFVFMHVYAGQRNTSAREFSINRFARLYPLHFATLLLVAALQFISVETLQTSQIYQFNDLKHFTLQIFFASNWGLENGHSFNGPIWSVSIEMLIYVAFFFYFKMLPTNLASVIAMTIAFTILFAFTDSMIALCGYYFFVGSLVYTIWTLTKNMPKKFLLGISVFSIIGTIMIMLAIDKLSLNIPLSLQLSAIFAAITFTLAVYESVFGNKQLKKFRVIGDITYSSYLLHSPIQIAFLILVGNGLINDAIVLSPVFYIGYFVFVCAAAWFTFKYFERPAQNYIRQKLEPAA